MIGIICGIGMIICYLSMIVILFINEIERDKIYKEIHKLNNNEFMKGRSNGIRYNFGRELV